MSRYGYDSDFSQGERDFERRGHRDYERDRYASWGTPDADYNDGFRSAERRAEERAEERREEERQERLQAEHRRQREIQEEEFLEEQRLEEERAMAAEEETYEFPDVEDGPRPQPAAEPPAPDPEQPR